MASVTSPDNIAYSDASDVVNVPASLAAQASSVQTALDKRQGYTYSWLNAAARTAQTGMVTMSLGFQQDTKVTYIYNGTAWKAWHTAVPITFTPTWTNLTVGNGTQLSTYTLSSGRVAVSGFFTLGSTSSVGSNPYMTAPLPLNGYITSAPNGGSDRTLGSANFVDAGVLGYPGACNSWAVSSVVYVRPQLFRSDGLYTSQFGVTSTTPFTWATGDYLTYEYGYMAD